LPGAVFVGLDLSFKAGELAGFLVATPLPPGVALPGAVFVGLDLSFSAGELAGFLVEGVGAAWMGFLEPIAERAGFGADPADPAASFAGEDAAPPVAAFFAGVTDFAPPLPPGAALPGAVFVGVDLSFKAGALPGPVLLLIFLGAAFLGGSLSTILIFDTPSADRCQSSVR
jgi:hypothetical protein